MSIVFDEVSATVAPEPAPKQDTDAPEPRADDDETDVAAHDRWLRRRAWQEARRRAD